MSVRYISNQKFEIEGDAIIHLAGKDMIKKKYLIHRSITKLILS